MYFSYRSTPALKHHTIFWKFIISDFGLFYHISHCSHELRLISTRMFIVHFYDALPIFDREPCKFSFTCEFCQVIVIFIYSCDNIDHFMYFWAPKFLLTFSLHFEDSYFKFINLSSIKLLNLANSKWIKTFFPSPNVIVHIFDVAVRCKTNAPDIDRYSVWIIRDQVHEAYEFGSQMSIIIFNRNGF